MTIDKSESLIMSEFANLKYQYRRTCQYLEQTFQNAMIGEKPKGRPKDIALSIARAYTFQKWAASSQLESQQDKKLFDDLLKSEDAFYLAPKYSAKCALPILEARSFLLRLMWRKELNIPLLEKRLTWQEIQLQIAQIPTPRKERP